MGQGELEEPRAGVQEHLPGENGLLTNTVSSEESERLLYLPTRGGTGESSLGGMSQVERRLRH